MMDRSHTLCQVMSSPDPSEFEAQVADIVDVPEWSLWYGIMGILNNEENASPTITATTTTSTVTPPPGSS